MGVAAGCMLTGHTLGASMGATQSRVMDGCGDVEQDRIGATKFLILCRWHSVRSYSSSRRQRDTTFSRCMAANLATICARSSL